MQSSLVTLSLSWNHHFHWMVHWVTRVRIVMGFPQISYAMTYQSRGSSERSDFIQTEEIHIVIGKLLIHTD